MTAITAVTSQNTTGVNSVFALPPSEIENQIIFTSKDIKPDAIKIGMLHSSKVVFSVIKALKKIKTKKIILDPVMVAKGGFKLINDKAINVLKNKLIMKVDLITPNIPEAEILTNIKINNLNDMKKSAKVLLGLGVKNVLIKGGHSKTVLMHDIFLNKKKCQIFKSKRIRTKNTHGTGCTLSSAIATFYACGKTLNKSCELAIKYVNQSIRSNLNYGRGHGPINHLNSIKINRKFR